MRRSACRRLPPFGCLIYVRIGDPASPVSDRWKNAGCELHFAKYLNLREMKIRAQITMGFLKLHAYCCEPIGGSAEVLPKTITILPTPRRMDAEEQLWAAVNDGREETAA
jgi:hypothetical protein